MTVPVGPSIGGRRSHANLESAEIKDKIWDFQRCEICGLTRVFETAGTSINISL